MRMTESPVASKIILMAVSLLSNSPFVQVLQTPGNSLCEMQRFICIQNENHSAGI